MKNDDQIIEKTKSRYERAGRLEQDSLAGTMALNSSVYPKWIDSTDCFLYELETILGKEYRLIDSNSKLEKPAFDHVAFAKALKRIVGEEVDPENLPITNVNLRLCPFEVEFEAFNRHWSFVQEEGCCKEVPVNPAHWLVSPDGEKAVFIENHNLWIRHLDSGKEYPLTTDGELQYSYGAIPERADLASRFAPPVPYASIPQMLWSPDSKRLITMQTDERQVIPLPMIAYVPRDEGVRPKLWEPRYALPSDNHVAEYRMLIIDVEEECCVAACYSRVLDTGVLPGPFMQNRVWWSKDSDIAFFVDMSRYEKQARVVAFDAVSGACQVLIEETADTYIDLNLMNEEPSSFLPLPDSNELIWFSERSGWAHLYLYSLATGELKKIITQGPWLVREVLGFDPERRDVYFQAAGRDKKLSPYYREICRANVDTGEIVSLASGDYDYVFHKMGNSTVHFAGIFGRDVSNVSGLSPTGNFFVTTRTRVDEIPVSELRDREGNLVLKLAEADITNLPKEWRWPEPVKLVSADGVTEIYGVVFRPSDFDADKKYPVIDYTIGLSVITTAPRGAFGSDGINSAFTYLSAAAWAELGFIVVIIDGRGTVYRDKAFHDQSYGRLHTASNLSDHIAGITQLAEKYPYMDIDRVGIAGPGGCNAPVFGLLAHPEFYKVGVACSVYDIRMASGFESYSGVSMNYDQDKFALADLAGALKGKLLIIHGMLDNFFHPSGMFQLVDALAKANKNVDMLILPNGGHVYREGYQLRRAWDYMVEHLQEVKPPEDFLLYGAYEFALGNLSRKK